MQFPPFLRIFVLPAVLREERGPYGDPQHPYLYEEEDAWQAPGFVNQFYEVGIDFLVSSMETHILICW